MARYALIHVLSCAVVALAAAPALGVIPGAGDPNDFDDPTSAWYGMDWDHVHQLDEGAAVAVGYFALLSARHVDLFSTITINGDEFEVVEWYQPPADLHQQARPDLRLLFLRNNTDPSRPLPGFYDLYSEDMETDDPVIIVGAGRSGWAYPTYCVEDTNSEMIMRWGTERYNRDRVKNYDPDGGTDWLFSTHCFEMVYNQGSTEYESVYGYGDSGGGVFIQDAGGDWQLAGINVYRSADGLGHIKYSYAAHVPYYREWLLTMLAQDLMPGDIDADGDVDVHDYALLKANFGTTAGADWENGDFDWDGDVDFRDYVALRDNWGCVYDLHPAPGGAAFDGIPAAAVPEPAAAGLLALGALALLRRRRKAAR